MDDFSVTLETKHLIASTYYSDNRNCPLCIAIREKLSIDEKLAKTDVVVTIGTVDIGETRMFYRGKLWYSYVTNNGVEGVDRMITLAKDGKFELEPVTINITKIKPEPETLYFPNEPK